MRALRGMATGAALLIAATAGAGEIAPELEARLATAGADTLVPVLVRLHEPSAPPELPERLPRAERRRQVLERLHQVQGARAPMRVLADAQARGTVRDVERYWLVSALTARATPDAIRALADDPDVAAIAPQTSATILPLTEIDELDATPQAVNGVVRVRAPQVWALGDRGAGAVVGVIDTGVVPNHKDLTGRWRGGAGWRDLVHLRTTRYDDNGHGTHVTGTAVGHAGVNANVIGVAPGAAYIACKAFAADGFGDIGTILGCLQFMADPDGNPLTDDLPDVVNGSWGGDVDCDPTFVQAVHALRLLDVVAVFAAGNAGVPATPAGYRESLAVGAIDRSNVVTAYSGRGPSSCRPPGAIYPDVVAPGTKVRSAWPGGKRKTLQGTSMAAPHVSGVVALLRSWSPQLSAAAIVNVLRATAADLGPAGPDGEYGYGLVDAFRAINCLRSGTVSGCGATCP